MHHGDTRKPRNYRILYYSPKGGVHETDKKCSIYSCSRRTKWPMVVFYRVLNLAGVNAFILYNQLQGKKLKRDFIKKLARSLVLLQMKRRVINIKLTKELR